MNVLVISSLLFFIPLFICNRKNIYEIALSLLFFINIICSCIFWSNPIQYSMIHQIDGVLAKISIILFTSYVIFYKKQIIKNIYLSTLINCCIMFYFSDYNSRIEWCSNNHIICHFIFHIFIIIGSTIVLM
jgi:hypothetical protein